MADTPGANVLGSVTIQIGAPLDTLQTDFAKAEQLSTAFNAKINAALSKSGGAGLTSSLTAAVATSAAAMGPSLTKPVADAAEKIKTLEKATEESTAAFSLNRVQMLELTHVGRELATMFAMGVDPMRAFTMESGRIATFFTNGDGGMAATFMRFLPIIGGVAAAFAVAGVGIEAFRQKLNAGKAVALSFFDTLKGVAVTAWQAFTSQFSAAPAWLVNLWGQLGTIAGDAINNIIQQLALLGANINETFSELPLDVESAIQAVANTAITWLNDLTDGVNAVSAAIAKLTGQTTSDLTPAQTHLPLLSIDGDPNAKIAALKANLKKQTDTIGMTDYLGQIYKNGLPSANDNASKASTSAYQKETAALQQQLAALQQTDREQAIANALAEAHVTAASKDGQQIETLAGQLYDQKAALQAANDAANFFGQTLETSLEGLLDGTKSLTSALGDVARAILNAALQAELLGQGPLAGLLGTAPSQSGGLGGIGGLLTSLLGGGLSSGLSLSTPGISSALGGDLIGPAFAAANGTDFAPGGLTLVGEKGPELVNLPAGASVSSASKTAALFSAANSNASKGGDTYVTVPVTFAGVTDMPSFQKSQAQIVTTLSRAVGRSRRYG